MVEHSAGRLRSRITCLAAAFACALLIGFFSYALFPYIPTRPDPRPLFELETGFPWPSNSEVISTSDNHSGFVGDGEFHLVLQVDDATLSKLLEMPPASPLSAWQPGPVPTEIGFHCRFGTTGVSAVSMNGGPMHYSGDPTLKALLSSDEIVYSAHERCCDGALDWHNGTLLIADPRTNRVWLSIWDF